MAQMVHEARKTKIPKGKAEIQLKDKERTKCEVWTRVMGYFRPTSSF